MTRDVFGLYGPPNDLLTRVQDEADLCRNEGANDIANLLDEVAAALQARPEGGKVEPTQRDLWVSNFIDTCAGPAFSREQIRQEAMHIANGTGVYRREPQSQQEKT